MSGQVTQSVMLDKFAYDLNLEIVYTGRGVVTLASMSVERPGLQLAGGFFDYFDPERIQIIGREETSYLKAFSSEERSAKIEKLFSQGIPVVFVTHVEDTCSEIIEQAKKYGIPVLASEDSTSNVLYNLISSLNVHLAPRITTHGVLVEVYGEGILLLGESGVGKSETAIELVKRGHRLIADDAVEIRKVSNKTLVGSSPENIRHFIELRGIGIVNARRLFGIGSVKMTEKINMVIQLEPWDQSKVYDRMGLDNEYIDILGNKIPCMTIPVKPGRNLAVIIEVAAMNNRQKKMGYNAAQELLKRLGMQNESDSQNEEWGI